MRILAIDSDEYYHYSFQEALGPDHQLCFAATGREANLALREFQPEVIITELLLSRETGYDFLRDLFKTPGTKKFLTIIFTRIDNLEDVSAALELGVNHYLVKGRDTITDLKNLLLTAQNNV